MFSQRLTRWPLNVRDRHDTADDHEGELHHLRGRSRRKHALSEDGAQDQRPGPRWCGRPIPRQTCRALHKALTADGLDQIVRDAGGRAGLSHASCHELRHTCLTRLREAGMALEAIQAQAGHRSIESTRLHVHLANDWLADEYARASEAIDLAADTLALTAALR